MANTTKVKTDKQKAVETAKTALAKAREALDKNVTAANKNTLASCETAYKNATDSARRERFVTVGRDRAELVLVKLSAFAKCANRAAYEFTEADIEKTETAFREGLENCIAAFRAALAGKAPAAGKRQLSFD